MDTDKMTDTDMERDGEKQQGGETGVTGTAEGTKNAQKMSAEEPGKPEANAGADAAAGAKNTGSLPGPGAENEPTGKIDTVRKVISAAGCALMLLSILFPFLRMTEPNEAVTDLTRAETFAIGMPGWGAGPYVIWALIVLSCALILYFQFNDKRKKSRHGCRIAFLLVIFDVLTIAGFIAQYGPSDITFFPLAGFWLLFAGWLLAWIASFLHKRKKKPKKNRRKKHGKTAPEAEMPWDSGDGEGGEYEGDSEAGENNNSWNSGKSGESRSGENGSSGKKLYREMKKQQKLEREERMRKAAEGKNEDAGRK
ncbi:MAG: hypothetical protein LUE29_07775 [Lachnospiraceae bacterium]|nr:hypothetical protein [Lachnospiraceae bacterium]